MKKYLTKEVIVKAVKAEIEEVLHDSDFYDSITNEISDCLSIDSIHDRIENSREWSVEFNELVYGCSKNNGFASYSTETFGSEVTLDGVELFGVSIDGSLEISECSTDMEDLRDDLQRSMESGNNFSLSVEFEEMYIEICQDNLRDILDELVSNAVAGLRMEYLPIPNIEPKTLVEFFERKEYEQTEDIPVINASASTKAFAKMLAENKELFNFDKIKEIYNLTFYHE